MLGDRTWPGRLDRSRILFVVVSRFVPDCVVIIPAGGAGCAEDGLTEVTDTGVVAGGDVAGTRGGTNRPS